MASPPCTCAHISTLLRCGGRLCTLVTVALAAILAAWPHLLRTGCDGADARCCTCCLRCQVCHNVAAALAAILAASVAWARTSRAITDVAGIVAAGSRSRCGSSWLASAAALTTALASGCGCGGGGGGRCRGSTLCKCSVDKVPQE